MCEKARVERVLAGRGWRVIVGGTVVGLSVDEHSCQALADELNADAYKRQWLKETTDKLTK